jgi:hypothetical protein
MPNVMRPALWLSLLLCWIPMHAEVIELKNGNKITGKLTGINGETFTVRTDYGDIQVPRSDVISIAFPENEPKKADASASAQIIDEALVGTIYVNRTANFQVTFPKGWHISPETRRNSDATVVAILKSDDQSQFFMVNSEKFSGTLKTYQALIETVFKANSSTYEKLEEAPATLDGRSGVRLVFHGDVKSGEQSIKFKYLVYILPYDGNVVRVTFFTVESLFNDAEPVFEKIAASFSSLASK